MMLQAQKKIAKPQTTHNMATVKCNFQGCTNEFDNRNGKKYCSGTCRAKASVINRAGLGNTPTPDTSNRQPATGNWQPRIMQPSGPDHQSQYIINHLTKESDRWERLYNEEKAKREKLKEKNEELEKKIKDMEAEQRIASIENAKPSGLNGLLNTPAGEKLLEAVAPLMQRMLEAQPATAQVAGTNSQTPAALFEAWFSKLSMAAKQTVWDMLKLFSIMPEGELINYARQVIESLAPTYNTAASAN